MEEVAQKIKTSKKVIVVSGAGLSTAAGIPDFRSPQSGFYAIMKEKFNLQDPTELFHAKTFAKDPRIYYAVRKVFLNDLPKYKPTHSHYFIKLLEDNGLLLRAYTQNIDGLELKTNLSKQKLIQVHGNLATGTCTKCKTKFPIDYILKILNSEKKAPTEEATSTTSSSTTSDLGDLQNIEKEYDLDSFTVPTCDKCGGIVKPDTVLFGEPLPRIFMSSMDEDLEQCDLMFVMGTSLQVYPIASLPSSVNEGTTRVLVNMERAGDFTLNGKFNDYFLQGDLEKNITQLIELLGWKDQLEQLKQQAS